MKLILPMTKPDVAFYPRHAHLFSVLLSYPVTYSWIYNHYVLLRGWVHYNDAMFGAPLDCSVDFFDPYHWISSPWIYYQRISRELIEDGWRSPVDFVHDCICRGYYVYLSCDMYYMKPSVHYLRRHRVHEPFVYGFDDENNVFYVADFFRRHYEYSTCQMTEFDMAYRSVADTEQKDTRDGAHLITFRDTRRSGMQKVTYDLDVALLQRFIQDQLNSTNTTEIYHSITQMMDYRKSVNGKVYFGISVYDMIWGEMERWTRDSRGVDFLPFAALRGHKKMMEQRVDFLSSVGRLDRESFDDEMLGLLSRYSNSALRLVIRYNQVRDSRLIVAISDLLLRMKHYEEDMLMSLYESLR